MIEIPEGQIEQFCRKYGVDRLALFGSAAGPGFRSDSDVDVLVRFRPAVRVSFLTLGQMRRELEAIFGRPVDLVPQDGLKPAIRREVLGSAVVVYAA